MENQKKKLRLDELKVESFVTTGTLTGGDNGNELTTLTTLNILGCALESLGLGSCPFNNCGAPNSDQTVCAACPPAYGGSGLHNTCQIAK